MKRTSWKDPSYFIQKILIDKRCVDHEYTREIIERAQLPWEVISEAEITGLFASPYPENLSAGKRHLFLTLHKGQFFKECPATREYRCCDYHVLNTGMNCPIDCVYCILQAYLNNPWLSFFVNVDDLLAEVERKLSENPITRFRIGTGEFTDSLAIDRLTCLSARLVNFIAQQDNAMLELKTKSAVIHNLEGLDHRGKTMISWSLNSTDVLQTQELRAATLEERLAAAVRVANWGYKLGFHFDPIIEQPGWEKAYRETIERLFAVVPADSIAWISLGALRYLPKLKEIGTSRFPGSNIYFQEFIEGLDGKARYFRDNRIRLYSEIYQQLKQYADPKTCIYFCMESDEVWKAVMGFAPEEQGGLPSMLERAFFNRT